MPAGSLPQVKIRFNATLARRPRHRCSASPVPLHSAKVEPKTAEASASAASLSSRHDRQSSGLSTSVSITSPITSNHSVRCPSHCPAVDPCHTQRARTVTPKLVRATPGSATPTFPSSTDNS
jgi:hypothetical protein